MKASNSIITITLFALISMGCDGDGSAVNGAEPGVEGGPCYGNQTCNDDLGCEEGICVSSDSPGEDASNEGDSEPVTNPEEDTTEPPESEEDAPVTEEDSTVDEEDGTAEEEDATTGEGDGTAEEEDATMGEEDTSEPSPDGIVTPTECEEGSVQTSPCGLNGNGTQSSTCMEGIWGEFGPCDDPDECENGSESEEACGLNGNGVQTRTCEEGAWGEFGPCDDPDECENGSESEEACGLNGKGIQASTCKEGAWGEFQTCTDPDECVNDSETSEACGLNGMGTQNLLCTDGHWALWETCEDPDLCVNGSEETDTCGFLDTGIQQDTCTDGQWTQTCTCPWPTGTPGIQMGMVLPETLNWMGYAPGSNSPEVISVDAFFDCDGNPEPLHALMITTSQYGCGACSEEAAGITANLEAWKAQGLNIAVITLLIDNQANRGPTLDGALNWRELHGLSTSTVAIDTSYSMINPNQSMFGTPYVTVINPQTMQVVSVMEGYDTTHAAVLAQANSLAYPDGGGVCIPQCAPGTCGDDGCGEPCSCDEGDVCNEGVCECSPVCAPGTCGYNDGCGGTCNDCGGYECYEPTNYCFTACMMDANCIEGYFCDGSGTCLPEEDAEDDESLDP